MAIKLPGGERVMGVYENPADGSQAIVTGRYGLNPITGKIEEVRIDTRTPDGRLLGTHTQTYVPDPPK